MWMNETVFKDHTHERKSFNMDVDGFNMAKGNLCRKNLRSNRRHILRHHAAGS